MNQSYIIAARRTAIGRFGESLRDIPARHLAALAMTAVMQDAGVAPEAIEEVMLGHVLQAGQMFVGRNAAVDAGIPYRVPASTINQACASGMAAVQHADRMVRAGDRDLLLAGGVENMSMTPHLVRGARWGMKYGSGALEDEVANGLTCAITDLAMGCTAENIARRYGITRGEQDEFAARSQQLAAEAIAAGHFKAEIVPVEIPGRKGEVKTFDTDEHPRATSVEGLAKLKPAFDNEGTVTAGNASGINDAAAALVVASKSAVERHGLAPMARIVSTSVCGVEPEVMGMGPAPAINIALEKAGVGLDDIDLFEINEAFAAQVLGVLKEVPIPLEKLNVNGGAIALGHPIGCSGARVIVTLLHELRRRGLKRGLATVCVGGGMGSAVIVEMLP